MNAMIEPFFLCLLASMIWAPIVFLGASYLAKHQERLTGKSAMGGTIWPTALVIAALPVLLAPIAASFGISMRAGSPLPPMMELANIAVRPTTGTEAFVAEAPTTVSLADILRMSAVLYFYGFVMVITLAAIRHVWFSYRLNFALSLDEPQLETALEMWRVRIGVSQHPRYVFSHIVSSVCVYGVFRPVVVLPYNLLDRVSIKDAALMGAHEMAHIKRGDVALFALCSVAKAVFWFNPFMHRICAQANLAAEQGADALVLSAGVDRHQYANCFVQGLRLAAGARSGFAGELIPSFTPFDKQSRRARLDAILSGGTSQALLSTPSKIALIGSAIFAAGIAVAQATIAVAPPPARVALPVTPVNGEITISFGETNDGKKLAYHEGVDIRAKRGTPVLAAGDGKVIDATDLYRGGKSWGKVVVIDHGHGLVTRYAHLDSYKINKGDRVAAGDVIANVGSTGNATGPHLHFEVIENGTNVDPSRVIIPDAPRPLSTEPPLRAPRAVAIVPAASSPSSKPALAPAAPEAAKNAHALDNKLAQIEHKLRNQFSNFDAFQDFNKIEFSFDSFQGAKDVTALIDDQRKQFQKLAKTNNALPTFQFNAVDLTEAEIEAIRQEGEQAWEDAQREIEAARDEIEAEFRHEFSDVDHEQFEREWSRTAKREIERAKQEISVAFAEAERERQQEIILREEEMLDIREDALRDAKADLEQELRDIKRRRKELLAENKR
ncbi:M23/M56 family metallopeptidase [Hyphococcus lacteus]|uniref:Peptidoglycan DD-metalloendopeptidase family protein n=1 Tax=Hyphococcus lacteus TaxID=3143536 RepID=A0ABV3YZT8_9PROT